MSMAAVALMLVAPRAASAQAFSPDQLSEMPKIKSASQAKSVIERAYPRQMQEAGVGGKVQIRFVVNPDGSVDATSVEVVAASMKALGEAAAEAVRKIEFVPGKKDGSAVASVVVMPISFGKS
jgi:protein TonB